LYLDALQAKEFNDYNIQGVQFTAGFIRISVSQLGWFALFFIALEASAVIAVKKVMAKA